MVETTESRDAEAMRAIFERFFRRSPEHGYSWAEFEADALTILEAASLRSTSRDSEVHEGKRGSYLVQSDFDRLEDWCRLIRVILADTPFLVGSVTERPDYRDVDVRVILRDWKFDRLFRGRLDAVRFLNRAFSVWGQHETGLPIDFQVQRMTEANAEFSKPRNAMGIRDWSTIPTSGVPKP